MMYLRMEMYHKNIEILLPNKDDDTIKYVLLINCGKGIVTKWPEYGVTGNYEVEGKDDIPIKLIRV